MFEKLERVCKEIDAKRENSLRPGQRPKSAGDKRSFGVLYKLGVGEFDGPRLRDSDSPETHDRLTKLAEQVKEVINRKTVNGFKSECAFTLLDTKKWNALLDEVINHDRIEPVVEKKEQAETNSTTTTETISNNNNNNNSNFQQTPAPLKRKNQQEDEEKEDAWRNKGEGQTVKKLKNATLNSYIALPSAEKTQVELCPHDELFQKHLKIINAQLANKLVGHWDINVPERVEKVMHLCAQVAELLWDEEVAREKERIPLSTQDTKELLDEKMEEEKQSAPVSKRKLSGLPAEEIGKAKHARAEALLKALMKEGGKLEKWREYVGVEHVYQPRSGNSFNLDAPAQYLGQQEEAPDYPIHQNVHKHVYGSLRPDVVILSRPNDPDSVRAIYDFKFSSQSGSTLVPEWDSYNNLNSPYYGKYDDQKQAYKAKFGLDSSALKRVHPSGIHP